MVSPEIMTAPVSRCSYMYTSTQFRIFSTVCACKAACCPRACPLIIVLFHSHRNSQPLSLYVASCCAHCIVVRLESTECSSQLIHRLDCTHTLSVWAVWWRHGLHFYMVLPCHEHLGLYCHSQSFQEETTVLITIIIHSFDCRVTKLWLLLPSQEDYAVVRCIAF